MSTITVFTPAYNRAHTLERAFKSLLNQTSKDFEWLIIDDVSTDNTAELVHSFISKADFNIRYYKKENGGRHTAVNFSYPLLRTKYVVTLDSDDELVSNAIEKMIVTWKSIPVDEYDRFWCISGREQSSVSHKMVGKPYPNGINKLKGRKQRKAILKCKGEKHCCRKVSIHIQYPFPEYPDGGVHKRTYYKSCYYAGLFYVNNLFDELFFNSNILFSIVNVSKCAMLTGVKYKNLMMDINKWYKKFIVTLGYPISWLWIKTHKKKVAA